MAGMHYLHQLKVTLLMWSILATLVVVDFHFFRWQVSSSDESSEIHYEIDHLSQVKKGKAAQYLEKSPSYFFSLP